MLKKPLYVVFIWIPFLGAMIGLLWSRFVPSVVMNYLGVALGAVCAVAWVALAAARRPAFDGLDGRRLTSRVLRNAWGRGLVMALAGFMFGYVGFAWGYPWLLNRIVGSLGERIVTVTGWSEGGYRSCAQPDVDVHVISSPDAFCVVAGARTSMPAGTRLRLVGPASPLGINVERIYVIPAWMPR